MNLDDTLGGKTFNSFAKMEHETAHDWGGKNGTSKTEKEKMNEKCKFSCVISLAMSHQTSEHNK